MNLIRWFDVLFTIFGECYRRFEVFREKIFVIFRITQISILVFNTASEGYMRWSLLNVQYTLLYNIPDTEFYSPGIQPEGNPELSPPVGSHNPILHIVFSCFAFSTISYFLRYRRFVFLALPAVSYFRLVSIFCLFRFFDCIFSLVHHKKFFVQENLNIWGLFVGKIHQIFPLRREFFWATSLAVNTRHMCIYSQMPYVFKSLKEKIFPAENSHEIDIRKSLLFSQWVIWSSHWEFNFWLKNQYVIIPSGGNEYFKQ